MLLNFSQGHNSDWNIAVLDSIAIAIISLTVIATALIIFSSIFSCHSNLDRTTIMNTRLQFKTMASPIN